MSVQSIPQNVVSGKAGGFAGTLWCDADRDAPPPPQPADDGRGHFHGHRPTAIGTPDPQDHSSDPAARATYLLEYSCDVVARVRAVAPQVACHLDAQLAMLYSNFQAVLARQDALLLDLLIDHLDVVLAPGELLLVEVER